MGIDVVHVARIERAMRTPRFAARVLSEREAALGASVESVAGRWAAKEATMKALGRAVAFRDVEVLLDPRGAPKLELAARLREEGRALHVSITHDAGLACAVVIHESLVLNKRLTDEC